MTASTGTTPPSSSPVPPAKTPSIGTAPVRLDRWLWAVRLYKTRTLAAEACRGGHVKVNGQPVKPSRDVRVGDLVQARTGELHRTVRVRGTLENRLATKAVPLYLEDLTPPEEVERARNPESRAGLFRAPGSGRPTKRDRRLWESWSAGAGDEPNGV